MNSKATQHQDVSWHSIDVEAVFHHLTGRREGLTREEAVTRISEYGPNKLSPPKKRSPFARFMLQFHNVLIYVLLAAGMVTALIGHWIDAGVIIGVVIINAVIGFIQEGKAEKALEAIRTMLSSQATVLRDGKRITVPADKLVPGDIVFVQTGDKVPADTRLFKIKELRIDEAALTGESLSVEKSTTPVDETATVGLFLWDRLHNQSVEYARTVAVNTLVMFEIFYLLNTRFLKTPVMTKGGFSGNKYVYIAIGAVLSAQIVFT